MRLNVVSRVDLLLVPRTQTALRSLWIAAVAEALDSLWSGSLLVLPW